MIGRTIEQLDKALSLLQEFLDTQAGRLDPDYSLLRGVQSKVLLARTSVRVMRDDLKEITK